MGSSLYSMLHRRYGRRPTGAERTRRARVFQERLRAAMPVGLLRQQRAAARGTPSVAVVGAGLAGCCAGFVLQNAGCNVQLFGAAGAGVGRVWSSDTVVPGRILEVGGELIGLNHPLWLLLAELFGFALGVVTPDDDYAGAGLDSPLQLNGQMYDDAAASALYDAMTDVFTGWTGAASVVTSPYAPWNAPGAAILDAMILGDQIPCGTAPDVAYAIGLEFELNNTVPIFSQSWLANLAQFKAGQSGLGEDGLDFFSSAEVFRCTAGNQALARAMASGLPFQQEQVIAIDTESGVTLYFASGEASGPYDAVIVATSVDAWDSITVDGGGFPYQPIQYGSAVKYLAPVDSRFWIPQGLAPSAMSDELGMVWEGTDNQAATAGFDLSVFIGGTLADQAKEYASVDPDAYFAPLFSPLFPGFATPRGTFNYNVFSQLNILTAYSCPAPGQVTEVQASYTTPYNNCVYVAGEHSSPAWFGFMEGALESGFVAALRLLNNASMTIDSELGGCAAL